MKRGDNWLDAVIPAGWVDVVVRTVKAFVIALLVYHLKEWIDAGRFDTADLAIDALWMAGGTLILEAVLLILMKPKT